MSARDENYIGDIMLSKYTNSNLQLGEIGLIEIFEILDIQYPLSSADYIKTKPSFVSVVDIYNTSNINQSVTVNFQSQAS